MKLCSLKHLGTAKHNVITCLLLPPSDITLSAPLNSFAVINKQFSMAFHCCQVSLSDVNSRPKLA